MKILRIIATATLVLISTVALAQPQVDQRLKDEQGLKRIKIVYPESGESIDNVSPMITADASSLEVPMDPQTVVLTLNGTDVTADAEIMPTYVSYTPPSPLAPGAYEVRITAQTVEKKAIEPLSWYFTIKGAGPAGQAAGPGAEGVNASLSGSLSLSADHVKAAYVHRPVPDITQLFREKAGTKVNADLNFASVTMGRTILGSYHRETQDYTGISIDKGRINYYDPRFSAALGSFWFALSDLTVLGTELDGARLDRSYGQWAMTLFSGRTQDPSTSGTFRQTTSGARATYAWNDKSHTSITALSSTEDSNPLYTAKPTKESIIGLYHEYKYSENTKAVLEFGRNTSTPQNSVTTNDTAYRALVTDENKVSSSELEMYRIGKAYLPIAEGSSRYLRNDRKGYRMKSAYKVNGRLSTGGEIENYTTVSSSLSTKRFTQFATVTSGGNLQSATISRGKLTSNGATSKTAGATVQLKMFEGRIFGETRAVVGWQNIDFSAANILTKTTIKLVSLNSSYKDVLGVSLGYSDSFTDDRINAASNANKNISLGLNWNIIPFKLILTSRAELLENTGSGVQNRQKTVSNTFKYFMSRTTKLSLAYDTISYFDQVSDLYNYKQKIVRTGVERQF